MPELKRILVILILIYSSIVLIFFFFQEKIIFQPEQLSDNYTFKLEHTFEEIFLKSKDGISLNAIHFKNRKPKGVILYFHGNKGNLKRWGKIVLFFVKKQYDVIVMDYRSYGKSKGEITEENLYTDAQLFYDYALKYYSEDQITVYGRSLGTGIATNLASCNQPSNLILETPYFTMNDVVENWLPYFPTNVLLKYKMPSNVFIQNVACNITIYHGTSDGVIPYGSGQRLFNSILRSNKTMITINGGDHNNLIEFDAYLNSIDQVLNNK